MASDFRGCVLLRWTFWLQISSGAPSYSLVHSQHKIVLTKLLGFFAPKRHRRRKGASPSRMRAGCGLQPGQHPGRDAERSVRETVTRDEWQPGVCSSHSQNIHLLTSWLPCALKFSLSERRVGYTNYSHRGSLIAAILHLGHLSSMQWLICMSYLWTECTWVQPRNEEAREERGHQHQLCLWKTCMTSMIKKDGQHCLKARAGGHALERRLKWSLSGWQYTLEALSKARK